jgi:hypothetical protein
MTPRRESSSTPITSKLVIQDEAQEGAEMTDDDIHALIIDLIESHVDEEDRQLVLDWVMARKVAFDFLADKGIMTPDDWAGMGLPAWG